MSDPSDQSEPIRLEVESVNDAIDESDETSTPVEQPHQADERDESVIGADSGNETGVPANPKQGYQGHDGHVI